MSSDTASFSLRELLLSLGRFQKRAILAVCDAAISVAALWLAFLLRIGPPDLDHLLTLIGLFIAVPIATVFFLWIFGLYNHLLRELEIRTLYSLAIGLIATAAIITAYSYFYGSELLPRSIPVLFAILAFLLIGASRVFGRWYYRHAVGLTADSQPIIIYGAGETGVNTAKILENSREFSLLGFIDDDKHLQGSRIRGRKIYDVSDLDDLCSRYPELRILICIAHITADGRRKIIEKLQTYPVQVLTIPTLGDVVAGRADLNDLKEVRLQDLLGRAQVPTIKKLFEEAVNGKTILVSGGGGSIGSEICMQLAAHSPERIIILENNEFSLYNLEQRVLRHFRHQIADGTFQYVLCDVLDFDVVNRIMQEHQPQVVYHAAAYKHVPLVERQPLRAIENNIIGTHNVAQAASKSGASYFVLVSTDKAVRPTNVMGVTKRVAELVVQGMARGKSKTIFSSVRFGNVLGSPGSVIPLFREQIASAGPVTVTHPEVTRCFMTVSEAAQLVIQAGFLAKGGDIFVLDMGEPIQIEKLARLMIQLSGKTTRDTENPNGDIEIVFTGLRPGEKLYEDSLLSDNATGTIHPKIMIASEASFTQKEMQKHIASIRKVVAQGDEKKGLELLEQLVEGFTAKQ